jgi:hypothetical protein
MRTRLQILTAALLSVGGALSATPALAGSEALLLVHTSLSNISDPNSTNGDLWQYEGGIIENATTGSTIGHYMTNRRFTVSGGSTDNAAAMTTSLFFTNATSGAPPNNLTLEGAWSFTSGQFIGSVSAASFKYHIMIGSDVTMVVQGAGVSKVSINWDGGFSIP